MFLSLLQKYILLTCLERGGQLDRKVFRQFYDKQKGKTSSKYQESIITKSIERLVDKELMMGYGRRTPHKWFITHVGLTVKGKQQAHKILQDKQKKLPLK